VPRVAPRAAAVGQVNLDAAVVVVAADVVVGVVEEVVLPAAAGPDELEVVPEAPGEPELHPPARAIAASAAHRSDAVRGRDMSQNRVLTRLSQ
jgi:hypothetical protein